MRIGDGEEPEFDFSQVDRSYDWGYSDGLKAGKAYAPKPIIKTQIVTDPELIKEHKRLVAEIARLQSEQRPEVVDSAVYKKLAQDYAELDRMYNRALAKVIRTQDEFDAVIRNIPSSALKDMKERDKLIDENAMLVAEVNKLKNQLYRIQFREEVRNEAHAT